VFDKDGNGTINAAGTNRAELVVCMPHLCASLFAVAPASISFVVCWLAPLRLFVRSFVVLLAGTSAPLCTQFCCFAGWHLWDE